MSKKYYLGVDIGTYESKGVLIDQDYNLIANKAVRHDLENPNQIIMNTTLKKSGGVICARLHAG